jgi:hypothetical protein
MKIARPLFLSFILFLGFSCIFLSVDYQIFGGIIFHRNLLIEPANNALISYSFLLSFFLAGVGLVVYVLLILKGVILIQPEISNTQNSKKLQSCLISSLVFIPAAVLFTISGYYMELFQDKKLFIGFIFIFTIWIYDFLRNVFEAYFKRKN